MQYNISNDDIIFKSDCNVIFSSDMSLFIEDDIPIPQTIGVDDTDIEDGIPRMIGGASGGMDMKQFIEDGVPQSMLIEDASSSSCETADLLSESARSFGSLQVQVAPPMTTLERAKTMPVTKPEHETDLLLTSVRSRQSRRRKTTSTTGQSSSSSRSKNEGGRTRVSSRRERTRTSTRRRRQGSIEEQEMVHRDRRQMLRSSCKNLSMKW